MIQNYAHMWVSILSSSLVVGKPAGRVAAAAAAFHPPYGRLV